MKKIVLPILILFASHTYAKSNDTALIRIKIDQITDIDFHLEEYKINFALSAKFGDTNVNIEKFKSAIEVHHAKDQKIQIIDWNRYDSTLELRGQCVMGMNSNVEAYPFDQQKIRLVISAAQYNKNNYVFKFLDSCFSTKHINYIKMYSGWTIDTAYRLEKKKYQDNSTLNLQFVLKRHNKFALFLKLFIGMYVAFLVAYMAFAISVEDTEARFGLPVGGLFAAVGNKYVIESLLPNAPGFTLADWLHTTTILFILLIIVFSAMSLQYHYHHNHTNTARRHVVVIPRWIVKRKKLCEFVNRSGYKIVLYSYLTVNALLILWGAFFRDLF